MFKKQMSSSNNIFIVGDSSNPSDLFYPGFRFRIAGMEYTVKADCTKDPHASMREVFRSDGGTEIVPIETLIKDIDDPQAEVLEPDMRLVPDSIKKKMEIIAKEKQDKEAGSSNE